MEYIVGIILYFLSLAWLITVLKATTLMIGFLVITIVWTVLPLFGTLFASADFLAANEILQFSSKKELIAILNKIYQSAPEGGAPHL